MRDYRLLVPSDCVASNSEQDTQYSLRQMKNILRANIRPSLELELRVLQEGLSNDNELPAGKIITVY
jgi:hypothetical protein